MTTMNPVGPSRVSGCAASSEYKLPDTAWIRKPNNIQNFPFEPCRLRSCLHVHHYHVCILLPTHLFLLVWNSVFFLGLYGEVNDLFWVQSVHLVINFSSSSSWACNSWKRDYAPEQLMIVSTSPIWHSVRRAIILWHLQVSHSEIWIKTLLRKHLKFSFQNSNKCGRQREHQESRLEIMWWILCTEPSMICDVRLNVHNCCHRNWSSLQLWTKTRSQKLMYSRILLAQESEVNLVYQEHCFWRRRRRRDWTDPPKAKHGAKHAKVM